MGSSFGSVKSEEFNLHVFGLGVGSPKSNSKEIGAWSDSDWMQI